MFATEKDRQAAQSRLIMFNNFWVYWINREKRETRRRESIKEERGRSWDRFSQTFNTEKDRNREKRVQRSRFKKEKNSKNTYWEIKKRIIMQNQDPDNEKHNNKTRNERENSTNKDQKHERTEERNTSKAYLQEKTLIWRTS